MINSTHCAVPARKTPTLDRTTSAGVFDLDRRNALALIAPYGPNA
jgi:hypothetical protein